MQLPTQVCSEQQACKYLRRLTPGQVCRIRFRLQSSQLVDVRAEPHNSDDPDISSETASRWSAPKRQRVEHASRGRSRTRNKKLACDKSVHPPSASWGASGSHGGTCQVPPPIERGRPSAVG